LSVKPDINHHEHRVSWMQRLARGRRASALSLALAVSVHAAVIGAGFMYYKSVSGYTAPHLVLPRGVSADAGSSGDVSPVSREAPPLQLFPPVNAQTPVHQALGPPPGAFEPPDVTPPPVVVSASLGTTEVGPLPSLSSGASPPPMPLRSSGQRPSDSVDRVEPSPPADNSDLQDRGSTGGGDASERQASSGGGPQGVIDGSPVPSTANQNPQYPAEARRRGWTGVAQLELDLDASGRVTAARLLRSSGHDVLDQAALAAARTWQYAPATMDGRPVAVTVPVPIRYSLASGH
jgi:protein TonB